MLYKQLTETNRRLNIGETLSADEKDSICAVFIAAMPEMLPVPSKSSRRMAPEIFKPPLIDGKKAPLITGYVPKTAILSGNAYELEILRLLALFDRESPIVRAALEHTRERLLVTCFGNFCETGECFEIAIPVLRFLRAAFPNETAWINCMEVGLSQHFGDRKRSPRIREYYALAH